MPAHVVVVVEQRNRRQFVFWNDAISLSLAMPSLVAPPRPAERLWEFFCFYEIRRLPFYECIHLLEPPLHWAWRVTAQQSFPDTPGETHVIP